ncbi:hypothetical protein [Thalassoglobus sp.]|uniref:hypothetical protein n=1 Tax=Thalassoglobus sp. TaxID=2795869 RepID=UPI003AA7CBE2
MSLSLSLTVSAVAQDSPLELFHKDVDLVLRLAEPDKTTENIVALVNGAQPGFGELARGPIRENLGKAISNPTLTGADQSRDWHVGIFTNGQAEPSVVFAIPAIEADDLVGALGDGFDSSVHGKYVLYTDKGDVPDVPDVANSLAKAMSEKAKAAFDMGEISLYVNSKHLASIYRDELSTAYDQVLEGLNQIRFAMPQDSGINIGPIIELYGTLAEHLFQGVRDSNSLTVAVSLGAKGVRIEEYTEFTKGSKTSKLLSAHPTAGMADLVKLPKGAIAYYGLSGGLEESIKWSMDLTAGMSQDADVRENLKKVFSDLEEVEFGVMVGSVSIGNSAEGLFQVAGIADVKPMDKFKSYMRNSIGAMEELKMSGMTQTSEIAEEAETYGDYKADVVTIKQEFDEDAPQAEMQTRMQKMLFGANGIQSRVIYMEDRYLTVMGGGPEATKSAVAGLSSSSNTQIEKPREILMKEANFIGLLDLPGGVAAGLKAASEMDEFPLPVDAQMVDNLNLTPSFIGLGIAIEADAIRCRTDIPIEQIQGISKLAMLFIGMQNRL